MNISRVTKTVAVILGNDTFAGAEDSRHVDVDLFLPNENSETVFQMARTAVALFLRCFTGMIRIHTDGDARRSLRGILESEAQRYGAPQRLRFGATEIGQWRLALGFHVDGAVCADASGWTARINGFFGDRAPA